MSVGRITNQMVTQSVLAEINQAETAMDTTEEQLSSGLTINEPSDNPSGASLAIQLNAQLSQLTGYTNNITDGTAWTEAASSALTTVQDEVQRVQELVVSAGNGTNSQSDLDADADEVNQLISSIKSAANSQYDGQYIFSGSATSTEPYQTATGDTFQGNTSAITRAIAPGTSVQVNANLSSVLGNGSAAGDGGILDTLETIASDLQSGNTSALNSTDLTNLTTNLGQLSQVQTAIGATQDQLQLASTQISNLQTSVTSELSNDEDTNMASAMTTYSNQQAAFEAALQAGASIVQTSLMNFLNTSG